MSSYFWMSYFIDYRKWMNDNHPAILEGIFYNKINVNLCAFSSLKLTVFLAKRWMPKKICGMCIVFIVSQTMQCKVKLLVKGNCNSLPKGLDWSWTDSKQLAGLFFYYKSSIMFTVLKYWFCSFSISELMHTYTCQLSRIGRESHACGLKTSISRRLTLAGQFLMPDWKMWVFAVLLDTISKNMLTQTHARNENHV